MMEVGDYVEKFSGEARYSDWLVAIYMTRKGGTRYVVEVDPQGFQMIVTREMIKPASRMVASRNTPTSPPP